MVRRSSNGLKMQGIILVLVSQLPGYLMVAPDGMELDVLFGAYAWIEEALTETGLDPAGYPVVKLPYLTLMKMESTTRHKIGQTFRAC